MQKQLDLVQILKDAPKGTPLWSPVYGNCTLEEVSPKSRYPIQVHSYNNYSGMESNSFTKEGFVILGYEDIGCVLWPSKDNQSWDNWHLPFKAGDFVHRVCTSGNHWISIHKAIEGENVHSYIDFDPEENKVYYLKKAVKLPDSYQPLCTVVEVEEERLATPEEKEQLLKALAEQGYSWNADKLCFDKIIAEQYYTLKPFDKVLVRDEDDHKWQLSLFGYYNKTDNPRYPFVVSNGLSFAQCICYEGNEHLLGTTESPKK